jgi:hypothetical protein
VRRIFGWWRDEVTGWIKLHIRNEELNYLFYSPNILVWLNQRKCGPGMRSEYWLSVRDRLKDVGLDNIKMDLK